MRCEECEEREEKGKEEEGERDGGKGEWKEASGCDEEVEVVCMVQPLREVVERAKGTLEEPVGEGGWREEGRKEKKINGADMWTCYNSLWCPAFKFSCYCDDRNVVH